MVTRYKAQPLIPLCSALQHLGPKLYNFRSVFPKLINEFELIRSYLKTIYNQYSWKWESKLKTADIKHLWKQMIETCCIYVKGN